VTDKPGMTEYKESLFDEWGQFFSVDEVLHEVRSDHQHLVIFRNARFGRVLALDGVIQTTEADEFVYHEMLAHVPLFAHGDVRRILIVGGGDGGMLREVLRHQSVEQVTQVEIDTAVVEMSKKFLPNHSQGAFDDPRLELVIADGVEFVNQDGDQFDVIISDSTDPLGPGEALFTRDFYAGCKRRLAAGGILAAQNGNAFGQLDEVTTTARHLYPLFDDAAFYAAAVPTYVGGIMAFAWGTDDQNLRRLPVDIIAARLAKSGLKMRYYTPAVHVASFALPQFVESAIEQAIRSR